MLLLTFGEYYFIGTHLGGAADRCEERMLALATDLDFIPALDRLKVFEQTFRQKYTNSAIEYALLSVATIPGNAASSAKQLRGAKVDIVESLPQSLQDFEHTT